MEPIFEIIEREKVWVSAIPLLEVNFTKEECFEIMNCKQETYRYSNQIQATFIGVMNTRKNRNFIAEWLRYCENYDLISPKIKNNNLSDRNYESFIAHREDQSILSLLCKRMKITPHLDPSQRGKFQEWYKNSQYPFQAVHSNDKYRNVIFFTQNSRCECCDLL